MLYDHLAHLCWEYEHLQVVHEHNGIYHVDQDLRNVAGNTDKENTSGVYKYVASEFPHILSNTEYYFSTADKNKIKYSPFSVNFLKSHTDTDYPPPKA